MEATTSSNSNPSAASSGLTPADQEASRLFLAGLTSSAGRHFLTTVGGALGLDGVLNGSGGPVVIAALMILVAIVWSILEKSKYASQIHALLNAAEPVIEEALPLIEQAFPGPDQNGQVRNSTTNKTDSAEGAKDATKAGAGVQGATPAPAATGAGPAAAVLVGLLITALAFSGCAGAPTAQDLQATGAALGSTLRSIQNNPGVQAAETAGISIGGTLATGSPEFSYVAPIAVNGLTALANGKNPLAVSGTDLNADSALITKTVKAAVPNNTGTMIAEDIADAYVNAMQAPGMPQNAMGANAVIGAIANGLTTGAGK